MTRYKKDGTPKEKPGTKVIVLDWAAFDKLCELQCTATEIASFFDCSVDTLYNRLIEKFGMNFQKYYALKSGKGKIALRRRQWQKAIDGNDTTMMIWLGKQYLSQSDKQAVVSGDADDKEFLNKFFGFSDNGKDE